MSHQIRVGRRADQQIRQGQDWWLRNRSKAPLAFAEDIESAFDLLRAAPGAGEPLPSSRIANLRRLLVSRIRYFIYYTVDEGSEIIEVLALWHTSRGQPPTL